MLRFAGAEVGSRGQALAGVVLGVTAVVGSMLLLVFLYWWASFWAPLAR